MMSLFWVALWSTLSLSLALSSGADHCTVHESSSLPSESSWLKSLQCHNDYESYVLCKWREHSNTTLQLWFKTEENRTQCVPDDAAVQEASKHRTVQCRYNTSTFSIGIKHTVFFLKEKTVPICLSAPHKPLELSQHLRARPPVNLFTHDAGDGGQQLSWSSPYPPSSPLNQNITYQLSYRTETQDNWTTEYVRNTSTKLDKQLLLPGCRYEARVRAQAIVGHWSLWSPVVTWQTEDEPGQVPRLHCVLDGEKEVMCSWEVSSELAHFITYQLACRHHQTAQPDKCCVNTTVTSDRSRMVLRYSCSLPAADPAHLLVELQPTHNGKSFKVNQHIRPKPPENVKVREKDSKWIVEWTNPNKASKPRLYYQVCYYRENDQGSPIPLNVPGVSMSLTILDSSLAPSQRYHVKVRSLLVPEKDSSYKGIPSEWTQPVNWTSHEASWSITALIYVSICVFVTTVFFTFYCTIPACRRRVVLWVDSVPSPGKSKILSEIKSANSWTLMQSENTSMCRVQHMDSLSTCSSDVSLWPTKESEKKLLEQDEGCWRCDNLPSPAEKVNSSDTSSMSFSGPYIFCLSPNLKCKSVDVKCEEEEPEKEIPSVDSSSPSPVNFGLFGEGYVCLPSRSVSRSTQDLVSHSDANTNAHRHDSAEQDQQHPDETDNQTGLSEPTSSHQPPAYTSGLFTPWPQGDTIQASGYCHLPTAHMTAEK